MTTWRVNIVCLSVVVLGAACGESEEDGDNVDPSALPACGTLNEDECAARSPDSFDDNDACNAITGVPLSERIEEEQNDTEWTPWRFVYCDEGGDGDGALITCATDPDSDVTYQFPSTRNPPGWASASCDAPTPPSAGGDGGSSVE